MKLVTPLLVAWSVFVHLQTWHQPDMPAGSKTFLLRRLLLLFIEIIAGAGGNGKSLAHSWAQSRHADCTPLSAVLASANIDQLRHLPKARH
jgi:hypothetical protein